MQDKVASTNIAHATIWHCVWGHTFPLPPLLSPDDTVKIAIITQRLCQRQFVPKTHSKTSKFTFSMAASITSELMHCQSV